VAQVPVDTVRVGHEGTDRVCAMLHRLTT
jgi:hypothetical protein